MSEVNLLQCLFFGAGISHCRNIMTKTATPTNFKRMDIATGKEVPIKNTWGINQELTLTADDISRLINSRTINYDAGVVLLLLMEFGTDYVMSGGEFFESQGDLAKFSLVRSLEPSKVGKVISKLKTAEIDWEKLSIPTQLNIPLAIEE